MNRFSNTLIHWYNDHKRTLPWRGTTNPYLIWISEIILQQTRVAQGYEYYVRFIDRFPTLEQLAAAEEEEVLKQWQGLGYYSRARNLHAAAKSMNGVFPTSYSEVIALKGVGSYTAAAICSFAYQMPYAVVDGNVYRVLARIFGIDTPIDSGAGKKQFDAFAQELLNRTDPATHNQALMEFGALQCVPLSPDCSSCPFNSQCVAFREDQVTLLPIKSNKTKSINRYFNYLYIEANGFTLLHRRTGSGIWQNLYEFPLIESDSAWTQDQLLQSEACQKLFQSLHQPTIRLLKQGIKHVLSHQVIYTNFYHVSVSTDPPMLEGYINIPLSEIDSYPVSKLMSSLLEGL